MMKDNCQVGLHAALTSGSTGIRMSFDRSG